MISSQDGKSNLIISTIWRNLHSSNMECWVLIYSKQRKMSPFLFISIFGSVQCIRCYYISECLCCIFYSDNKVPIAFSDVLYQTMLYFIILCKICYCSYSTTSQRYKNNFYRSIYYRLSIEFRIKRYLVIYLS